MRQEVERLYLPAQRHRTEVVEKNADSGGNERAAKHIEEADLAKSIACRESLGMDHDLKNRTSPVERHDVGTPGEARDKQAGHEKKIPTEQQDEPESHPHDLDLPCHQLLEAAAPLLLTQPGSRLGRAPKLRM